MSSSLDHTGWTKQLPLLIPAKWRFTTIKSLSRLITKGTTPTTYGYKYTNEGVLFLRVEDITQDGYIKTDHAVFIDQLANKYFQRSHLEANDILISIAGTIGRTYLVCLSDLPANVNQALALVRVDISQVIPNFLRYFIMSESGQKLLLSQLVQLAQANISLSQIASTSVLIPPLYEQRRIAHILDTLDTQIQQTERLIAKLQQVKLGLLHDLLTRGIDENGNMRDPVAHPEEFKNATFLQKTIKIPKKWRIQSLASLLLDIEAGKSPSCPDQPAGAGEWGVLKVSAVHPAGFRAMENKVITNSAYINPDYEVKNGDLLISRANTYDLVGIVCLVRDAKERLLLSDKTLRLQVDPKSAASKFLFYILQMSFARSQIEMHATGSSASMKNISQTSIENLSVYVPPLEEQHKMIDILNAHDIRIDTEEAHLAKLKQIKKGLMADLLTGRVRITQLLHGE